MVQHKHFDPSVDDSFVEQHYMQAVFWLLVGRL